MPDHKSLAWVDECGGRREVVLPPASVGEKWSVGPQEPLVVALARAHRWQEMLDKGEAASLTDLADRLKLNRSYVRRILCLALLAPDIVEAILKGAPVPHPRTRALGCAITRKQP